METNKVNVKIYGQEYVIAGDKPREEIIQVAAHVDMKMQEIGEACEVSRGITFQYCSSFCCQYCK